MSIDVSNVKCQITSKCKFITLIIGVLSNQFLYLEKTHIFLWTVNDANCDDVKDLYDESSNYIKTLCLVPLSKNFDESAEKCQSYEMFLYNADDPEAEKALLDFSNFRFRPSYGGVLYVEGKTSAGCSVVSNEEGLFKVIFIDCNNKQYFYCQFVRTPKAEELGNLCKHGRKYFNSYSIFQVHSIQIFVKKHKIFSTQIIIIFTQPA
jgi:hypothetical protein